MEESRHRVHLAVTDPQGRLLHAAGDPERWTFLRSAAKPFQALPLVVEGLVGGTGGITREELALCCGSHSGEAAHLQGVRNMLDRAGLTEAALECGPHPPMAPMEAEQLLRSGEGPAPIHNNCSGKHAGMLILARGKGWDPEGYRLPGHPVQERMREEVARWSGVPMGGIRLGIDGCGVSCFGLPLRAAARAFAALVVAADQGETGPRTVVESMVENPFMVAGTDRLCTEIMAMAGDRVVVKLGAEGIYAAGLRGEGVGIVLKVEDGARRACEVALVSVLSALGVFSAEEQERLAPCIRQPVPNTRGEEVAWLEAEGDEGIDRPLLGEP